MELYSFIIKLIKKKKKLLFKSHLFNCFAGCAKFLRQKIPLFFNNKCKIGNNALFNTFIWVNMEL